MHVAFVTTSWPSKSRPWAGHFIAGLAEMLANSGLEVSVLAPCFSDDVELEERPGVNVFSAEVKGQRERLVSHWPSWPKVLWSMSRSARRLHPDVWMAHWWPSLLAVPRAEPALTVLHGSDVDLLEKCPSHLARWIGGRSHVVAVSPTLASRFGRRSGIDLPSVCPLGADSARVADSLPSFADTWSRQSGPKVLTVARPVRGKGYEVASQVRRVSDGFDYMVVGDPAVTPAEVRALLNHADLCVIPSLEGGDLPSEGRPHIIAQALVAGVPCLGGPNAAVRQAMRELGQRECMSAGVHSLKQAIDETLESPTYSEIKLRAQEVGSRLTWPAVSDIWLNALRVGATCGVPT
jgi:glycosyltransferase involved in cell wall biosynthesis